MRFATGACAVDQPLPRRTGSCKQRCVRRWREAVRPTRRRCCTSHCAHGRAVLPIGLHCCLRRIPGRHHVLDLALPTLCRVLAVRMVAELAQVTDTIPARSVPQLAP